MQILTVYKAQSAIGLIITNRSIKKKVLDISVTKCLDVCGWVEMEDPIPFPAVLFVRKNHDRKKIFACFISNRSPEVGLFAVGFICVI